MSGTVETLISGQYTEVLDDFDEVPSKAIDAINKRIERLQSLSQYAVLELIALDQQRRTGDRKEGVDGQRRTDLEERRSRGQSLEQIFVGLKQEIQVTAEARAGVAQKKFDLELQIVQERQRRNELDRRRVDLEKSQSSTRKTAYSVKGSLKPLKSFRN